MSGPKLDNSKKAVIKIIENLHPEDIVHFVCYGTKIVTIFSNKQPKDKHELIKMVEKVSTEGCTNLSGGIEQGAALLNQHHKKGYTKRMFLFSDGLANEGVRDMDGITKIVGNLKNKHTIKVDSFGIGHDFDSNMMKNIAEYGSGAFFFIDQADEIPTLVNKALEGLLELVGEDCILTLRGVGSGVVKKIHGRDAQSLVSGANLGDLHQSNTRTQLAELEVAPKSEGQISVLNWELSFKPHNHNKRTVITGTLQLIASSDSNIVKKSAENDDVKVAVAVQKAGDSDEQIQNLLSQGRAKEALEEQSRQCAYIQEFAHQDKSGMMKNLLSNARKTEAMIRSEGASKKAFQKMSHNVYAKRRGSVKFASHYS
jgi:Ca-activated chloride channel family protein